MELYKQEIFQLAKEKADQIFYNSSEEHAAIVHQAIAQTAEKYISILSCSLCSEISNNGNYCSSIDAFLSNNQSHLIRVILTDYDEEFLSKPIAMVLKKYPSQVQVRLFGGRVTKDGKPVHFTFADDRMFRIETDIDKHMAYGNFNSPKQVQILNTAFNNVFNRSVPLNLGN